MRNKSRFWVFLLCLTLGLAILSFHTSTLEARGESGKKSQDKNIAADKEELRKLLDRSPYYFQLPLLGQKQKISFTELLLEQNAIFYFFDSSSPICRLEEPFVKQLLDWCEKVKHANIRLIGIDVNTLGEKALVGLQIPEKSEMPSFVILLDPGARITGDAYQIKEKGVPIFYFFTLGGFPVRTVEGFSRNLVAIAEKTFPVKELKKK